MIDRCGPTKAAGSAPRRFGKGTEKHHNSIKLVLSINGLDDHASAVAKTRLQTGITLCSGFKTKIAIQVDRSGGRLSGLPRMGRRWAFCTSSSNNPLPWIACIKLELPRSMCCGRSKSDLSVRRLSMQLSNRTYVREQRPPLG